MCSLVVQLAERSLVVAITNAMKSATPVLAGSVNYFLAGSKLAIVGKLICQKKGEVVWSQFQHVLRLVTRP